MKILITGGAGFIGKNFALRCAGENINFNVVDRDVNSVCDLRNLLLNYANMQSMCADTSEILEDVAQGVYDVVVHLAAVPRVPYSIEHPVETTNENIVKVVELLDACVRGKVKRFVFASSSSVYGNSEVLPVEEDFDLNPISPYALQKKTAEEFCRLYAKLYDLDTVCLRLFTVFGPLQTGDNPYATVICSWLDAVKQGNELILYGDGSQSRDFCYIDNVTDALLKASLYEGEFLGEAYNISCGETTSVNEIMLWFLREYDVKSKKLPRRIGDVDITHGSVEKAKSHLEYTPKVDIWEGLKRTADWYMKN